MAAEVTEPGIYQQPLVHKRWLFLADKLEGQPDLLELALGNITRWRSDGRLGDTRMLDEWERLIKDARANKPGMKVLLDLLRNGEEASRELKSCSPFAGVLTREERDQFTCAWTH